jgi:hypothetical protein
MNQEDGISEEHDLSINNLELRHKSSQSNDFPSSLDRSGPISSLGPEDVLFGRGGKAIRHVGNTNLRELVLDNCHRYHSKEVGYKRTVARDIFRNIHSRGGRFLERHKTTGFYSEVEDQRAMDKIAQSLRETKPRDTMRSKEGNKNRMSSDNHHIRKKSPPRKMVLREAHLPNPLVKHLQQEEKFPLENTSTKSRGQVHTLETKSDGYDSTHAHTDTTSRRPHVNDDDDDHDDSDDHDELPPAQKFITNEGVIVPTTEYDIVFGRGIRCEGNRHFRRMIHQRRAEYLSAPKYDKIGIAKEIVQSILRQGGRFLERIVGRLEYHPVEIPRAVKKATQALRQKWIDDNPEGGSVNLKKQKSYDSDIASNRDRSLKDTCIPELNQNALDASSTVQESPLNECVAKAEKRASSINSNPVSSVTSRGYDRLRIKCETLQVVISELTKKNIQQEAVINTLQWRLRASSDSSVNEVACPRYEENDEMNQMRTILLRVQSSERILKRQNEYLLQCLESSAIWSWSLDLAPKRAGEVTIDDM